MPIDEDEQTPRKFYSRLEEHEEASNFIKYVSSEAILSAVDHKETKNFLAQLARNIKLIISEYPENHVKRCRDINYWMNQKIRTPENSRLADDLKSSFYFVFNDIKWNKGKLKGIKVCDREKNLYPSANAKLMKELDDYCEIRDNNGCNVLKNKKECLKYNSYINGMKKHFTSQINEKCSAPDCNKDNYKIDDYCSLNNIDDTFREINCDALYKKDEIQQPIHTIKERSPLEIGFFIIVSFILFYLFILFLEKFTPVGSIIHRFRRRKYDLKRNIERVDDDRYSLYHSDKMPSDSENKRYYIEYARPDN
ncbi:PIR protein [Plasmodium vivax]|uniref:VIR protein n=1 Tax=Plasmodium vivax TaxID=5855 RepID=A0A565A3H5_PLAVI|nr:PIR protein [Plasmodium vivax]